MKRQLIVMRHAKSSWDSAASSDHERPLNSRGKRDAPRVARHLASVGWEPQLIVSSDSQRTRETASLLLAEWADGVEVKFSSSLYLGGPSELGHELQHVSDEVEVLLVLGHNPGWESVVHRLSSESVAIKTATAVLLTAECESWADAFQAGWTLESIVNPRDL